MWAMIEKLRMRSGGVGIESAVLGLWAGDGERLFLGRCCRRMRRAGARGRETGLRGRRVAVVGLGWWRGDRVGCSSSAWGAERELPWKEVLVLAQHEVDPFADVHRNRHLR